MTDRRNTKLAGALDLGQPLTTDLEFKDLVLPARTLGQLEQIISYGEYEQRMLGEWGIGKEPEGFRALFSGPSGTGKTLAATLIGKRLGRAVVRVDLSNTFSKYIGETEKNLSRLFDAARKGSAILLFDEADALFGTRKDVSDSQDRYANQEVSYLLQRIETFTGVVILSSNFKSSIDPAFLRRMQVLVDFPRPDKKMRARLLDNA